MATHRWSFLMPAEDHAFYRYLLAHNRVWLTPIGRAALVASFIGFASSWAGSGAFLVGGLGAGGLVAAWLVGRRWRPEVEITRLLPSPPVAGESLRYRVRVRNVGKRPLRELTVSEGQTPWGLFHPAAADGGSATLDELEPGEEADLHLSLRADQRGAYTLRPLLVGSSFPSGLVRPIVRPGPKQRLLVYPRFVTQRELELPMGRRYQPGGLTESSNVGDSTEFLGTREYREGDRLRDIHWPSYARHGKLVVKEYREEYFVRIGLVLDTWIGRLEHPRIFETRASIAAGVADALARRDHIIDLFATGSTVHHLQAGRALARLDHLLQLLACVEAERTIDLPQLESVLVQKASQLSSIVLLLADWDDDREHLVRRLREAGTGVRAVVVRDRSTTKTPPADVVRLGSEAREGLIR